MSRNSGSLPTDRNQLLRALAEIEIEAILGRQEAGGTAHHRGEVISAGIGVSPGIASGVVARSAVEALDLAAEGREPVLVVDRTDPGDNSAIEQCVGVVSAGGGLTSHTAIIARHFEIPAVCQADISSLENGDQIVVDGTAGVLSRVTGSTAVTAQLDAQELDDEHLALLESSKSLGLSGPEIYVAAQSAADVTTAMADGAKGVGLSRTEDLLPAFDPEVLTGAIAGVSSALDEIVSANKAHVSDLLSAAGGAPVRVRLFDAPSHEFDLGISETNPMMGNRGARFLVQHGALTRAQIKGMSEAGGSVEIMVPMVSSVSEAETINSWITGPHTSLGIMIETPAAAMMAGELARFSNSLSFGTNDLAQFTYAASRDDVVVPTGEPLSRLVTFAVEAARSSRPDVSFGLCGHLAGTQEGIELALRLGFDSVCVTPPEVRATQLLAVRQKAISELAASGDT